MLLDWLSDNLRCDAARRKGRFFFLRAPFDDGRMNGKQPRLAPKVVLVQGEAARAYRPDRDLGALGIKDRQ